MAAARTPTTPRQASEINKEWLEVAMSQYESRACPGTTVEVISFQINPGAKPGENFSSEVAKILVEAQVKPADGKPSLTHYRLFAKFLQGNEFERENSMYSKTPLRELLVFSEVMPALNAFQMERTGDKYHINIPEYVYGICATGEYVLVMRDLHEAGFEEADKMVGLDLPHLRMAVKQLAQFHAISHAFHRTYNFLEKYPDFAPHEFMALCIGQLGRVVIDGLEEILEGKEAEFPGVRESISKNKEGLVKKMIEVLLVSGEEPVVCLCHGDYWLNNIMFSYGETCREIPEKLMMIDWGVVSWRSPVTDLQYLIHSSTQLGMRKSHLEEVQQLYYDTFTSTAADLGAALPRWGFEDFLKEYRRTDVMGFVMGVLVTAVSLSKVSTSFNRGTVSSGYISTLKASFSRMLIPFLCTPRFVPYAYTMLKDWLNPVLEDIASGKNPNLTTRVMDLLVEAHERGVLDL